MICPQCKSARLEVRDSREGSQNSNSIRRRRVCGDCGYKFTTHETPDSEAPNMHSLPPVALMRLARVRIAKAMDELLGELGANG